MKAIIIYLLILNTIAFAAMGADKSKARRHKWRISENSFLILGLLGGGIGILLGMSFFHHKTKHLKFTLGIPVVTIINFVIFIYLIKRFYLN